jgi:hypothetical protein
MALVARDLPGFGLAPIEKCRIARLERDHSRVGAWKPLAGRRAVRHAIGPVGVGRGYRRFYRRCLVALFDRRVATLEEHIQRGSFIRNTDLDMRWTIFAKSSGSQLKLVETPGMGVDELVYMSEIFLNVQTHGDYPACDV